MEQRRERRKSLGQPQKQRAPDGQNGADAQHDLGMHGIALPRKLFRLHLADDQKADATEEDQRAGNEIQKDIIAERHKIPPAAKDVKAGVVERGNCMEQADADGFFDRIALYKYGKTQRRAAKFNDQCRFEQHGQKLYDAAPGTQVSRLADDIHAFEIDAAARRKHDACADGADAESADLNQDGNNGLPKGSKGVADIDCQQSCDADGACRGIERINIGKRRTRLDADRQHQQRRTEQNDGGKAERNDACRGQLLEYGLHTYPLSPSPRRR